MDRLSESKGFRYIGICGGGKMGMSFFNHISRFDFDIVFYIRNPNKLKETEESYRRAAALKSKKAGARTVPNGRVKFTDDIRELGETDIVFEFIREDRHSKRELIGTLQSAGRNPGKIIATGSSSFTPSGLSTGHSGEYVIGVHYIYPVQYIKTVEVIYGRETKPHVIEKVREFLNFTGKKPLLLSEEVGSVTTRILLDCQNEAFKLQKEFNLSPWDIDEIVGEDDYILPLFELADGAGLDIICNCITGHHENSREISRFDGFRQYLEEKIGAGHLGKKTGRGFYDYSGKGEARKSPAARIGSEMRRAVSDRLKLLYINSCMKLLDGCWTDSVELDDAFRELNQQDRGPVDLAFQYGLENLLRKSHELVAHGSHYCTPGIVKYAVEYGVGREDIDRQIRLFKMGGKRPDWHHPNFGYTV